MLDCTRAGALTQELRELGAMMMLGIRGAEPGDPELDEDLDACVHASVRKVVLFDRDVATAG